MRLRRETGFFTLKFSSENTLVTTKIQPGLSPEDFIGLIYEYGNQVVSYIKRSGWFRDGVIIIEFALHDIDTVYYYQRSTGYISDDPDSFPEDEQGGGDTPAPTPEPTVPSAIVGQAVVGQSVIEQ